jgi:Protein of unknown function (DUF4242)
MDKSRPAHRSATCELALSRFLKRNDSMPRYLVERSFPGGLAIPCNGEGAAAAHGVVGRNAEEGVTWVHSYVTPDKKKTFCIYDAPTPEAIGRVAKRNGLPVDRITEVRVLDPYFYH